MYLRYSASVVAPMQCSWPRASMGLSRFAASMPPSPEAPAPMSRWISSTNRTIISLESWISFSTPFMRSSNSPRYLLPATSAPTSSASSLQACRLSGTSALTMRWARPSTTVVLPTPGSPISTGLFLVRRDRMRMTRRISSSRPMTGSILPSRAMAVMSMVNLARFSLSDSVSAVLESTRLVPRMACTASCTSLALGMLASLSAAWMAASSDTAVMRWSTAMYESFCTFCSSMALRSTLLKDGDMETCSGGGSWLGRRTSVFLSARSNSCGSPCARSMTWRKRLLLEPGCGPFCWSLLWSGRGSRRATARWTGISWLCAYCSARAMASSRAFLPRSVNSIRVFILTEEVRKLGN
ncbi:hypothetical protein VTK73DRAFT_3379 [Phialemonium thermophilum]|uniref:Uncharacterized protein n=1 Tax=Phialemonium thermophilum TaxID=223376 RepID=A0ABR3VJ20_9PEZI